MASGTDGAGVQSPSGWRRQLRGLLLPGRKASQPCARHVRRPAYPPGYKFGYDDSIEGPPAFERVQHWLINEGYYDGEDNQRLKKRRELEITRQLPMYRPSSADTTQTAAPEESTDVDTTRQELSGIRPYQSQSACEFFRLPFDIRFMIYREVFGSTLAAFNPLRYKTRDEINLERRPSRLGPLLACRKMYNDALPVLKLLLRDLKLVNFAAVYLPYTMPMDWLSSISSLEIDHFFRYPPKIYYGDAPYNWRWSGEYWSMSWGQNSHLWHGMWDLIANRMPNLSALKFNGHVPNACRNTLLSYSRAESTVLLPLTWVHGPAYSQPIRHGDSTLPEAATGCARRPSTDRPPSRLKRLDVNLWWMEPLSAWQLHHDQCLSNLLQAEGCHVEIWHVSKTNVLQPTQDWLKQMNRLTESMYLAADPAYMKSYRSAFYMVPSRW